MSIAALVLMTALSADLRVGQQAPEFTVTSAFNANEQTRFPDGFKGKLILVQFYASWCGPCREEIPHVRNAYRNHRGDRFDVIGVSLDNSNQTVVDFTERNGMNWLQTRDADRSLTKAYGAARIPLLLLVDGDTGKILATTNQLRGPGLSNVIARELAKKRR